MESRSRSSCGRWWTLFGMLGGGQLLPSSRLDSLDHFADIDSFRRPAVETFLNLSAQCFQFDLAALFALFDQTQPFAHDLAGRAVAAALDQALNEAFEVFADAVACSHS